MHPSSGLTKEYSVTLNRRPGQAELARIAEGCEMGGVHVTPVGVVPDDTDLAKPNRIRIIVAEGRNREVSRGDGGGGEARGGQGRRRDVKHHTPSHTLRCATWWSTRGWRCECYGACAWAATACRARWRSGSLQSCGRTRCGACSTLAPTARCNITGHHHHTHRSINQTGRQAARCCC